MYIRTMQEMIKQIKVFKITSATQVFDCLLEREKVPQLLCHQCCFPTD